MHNTISYTTAMLLKYVYISFSRAYTFNRQHNQTLSTKIALRSRKFDRCIKCVFASDITTEIDNLTFSPIFDALLV